MIINRYEIFNKNKEKNYPWFKSDDSINVINRLYEEIKQKGAKLILLVLVLNLKIQFISVKNNGLDLLYLRIVVSIYLK